MKISSRSSKKSEKNEKLLKIELKIKEMSRVRVSFSRWFITGFVLGAALILGASEFARAADDYPRFMADGPASERINIDGFADPEFCSDWNPEYTYMGFRCCAKARPVMRGRKRAQCAPDRRMKWQYCDEMTELQKSYTTRVESGEIQDVLKQIESDLRYSTRTQSQCSVNTGFLAFGRRLIASNQNRVAISNPNRCTNFGSDAMVAMVEWLGRSIAKEYPAPTYTDTKLVVGDISAPRGGCISGRGGRRGHSSHTSGLDADIGFLTPTQLRGPAHFHRGFDATSNLWMLKQMFRNPYACVKVVFLDKKLIRKLEKAGRNDSEWAQIRAHLKHVKGHRDHFHVRVGEAPTSKGCSSTIDDEEEDDTGGTET